MNQPEKKSRWSSLASILGLESSAPAPAPVAQTPPAPPPPPVAPPIAAPPAPPQPPVVERAPPPPRPAAPPPKASAPPPATSAPPAKKSRSWDDLAGSLGLEPLSEPPVAETPPTPLTELFKPSPEFPEPDERRLPAEPEFDEAIPAGDVDDLGERPAARAQESEGDMPPGSRERAGDDEFRGGRRRRRGGRGRGRGRDRGEREEAPRGERGPRYGAPRDVPAARGDDFGPPLSPEDEPFVEVPEDDFVAEGPGAEEPFAEVDDLGGDEPHGDLDRGEPRAEEPRGRTEHDQPRDEEGRSRRRRRRRGGRGRGGRSGEESTSGPPAARPRTPAPRDNFEDDAENEDVMDTPYGLVEFNDEPAAASAEGPDDEPLGGDDDLDDGDLEAGRPSHRQIPTWSETVGILIETNMESRRRSPGGDRSRGGDRDRYRGGGDRHRGGDQHGRRGGR